jgi:hypothetical protein
MSDPLSTKRVIAAAEDAARHVFEIARVYNMPIPVWADGETIEIDPFTERRVQPLMFKEDETERSGDSPSKAV